MASAKTTAKPVLKTRSADQPLLNRRTPPRLASAGLDETRPVVRTDKVPLDIDEALSRIRKAIASHRKAALFELAEAGFTSVFEQLSACIISIRTLDEVTVPTARRLFEKARTPAEVAKLSHKQIDDLIRSCSFHEAKAATIREIAREAVEKHGGSLPCDANALLALKGVGPKCANLALGIACGQGRIGVDVHVHRVVNRWSYVQTASPEQTMRDLENKLPQKYWIEINALLVPFGKHICKGVRPYCSTCPVLRMCRQVGVTEHR
jgi:endonuclease III